MKKVIIFISAIAFSVSAFAGGYVTNTNQNARFLRNPARGASTEIDAIYSNPAGLSFMKEDGFYVSLNNQMAFQTRTITSTFPLFVLNGGEDTKKYKGTAQSFFIPSIQLAYKWKNWVVSGSFHIVGGGGSLKFKDGLPMFEAAVAGGLVEGLPGPMNQLSGAAALFSAALPEPLKYTGGPLSLANYSLDMRLNGSNITYGTQFGLNYKVKDMFSFYAGARLSFIRNGYDGYLRNVTVGINNYDAMLKFFNNTANILNSMGDTINAKQAQEAALGMGYLKAGAESTNIELNTKQAGWGISPVLGVDFNHGNFNMGIKYEFKTSIETKNKTKVNTSGVADFDDDVKIDNDLPALLSVGMSYKFCNEKFIVSTGFHTFFDKKVKMPNDKQEFLKHNTLEVLLGLEYIINDKFLVSAGGQITRFGLKDGFQSNMSFYCNSFSLGFGGAYTIIKDLTLNLAYLYTHYEKYTNKNPVYPGKEVYNRTSHAIGIGLDYRF
jgi:long-chain fatty acid transport protein